MHSYHRLYYHLIVHTKHRLPRLVGATRELVWDIVEAKAAKYGCHAIAMNGSPTHFHLLFRGRPTLDLPAFIGELKGAASYAINQALGPDPKFSWRVGYALFTVSYGHVERVRGYIRKQASHHSCDRALTARYTAEELRPWGGTDPVELMREGALAQA